MLSAADNETITRAGPGTPVGELFRRFWLPALLASELPHPDSDPLRLTLLNEPPDAPHDASRGVSSFDERTVPDQICVGVVRKGGTSSRGGGSNVGLVDEARPRAARSKG